MEHILTERLVTYLEARGNRLDTPHKNALHALNRHMLDMAEGQSRAQRLIRTFGDVTLLGHAFQLAVKNGNGWRRIWCTRSRRRKGVI